MLATSSSKLKFEVRASNLVFPTITFKTKTSRSTKDKVLNPGHASKPTTFFAMESIPLFKKNSFTDKLAIYEIMQYVALYLIYSVLMT